jgi:hypothetical protein
MSRSIRLNLAITLAVLGISFVPAPAVHATPISAPPATTNTVTPEAPHDFNLQVTPSPVVTTVQPGVKSTLQLRIQNNSTQAENLKIEPRTFKLSNDSSKVDLSDTEAPDIASWISFSQPKFSARPGEWVTEQITLNVPKSAGFSYAFALVITRQNPPKATGNSRQITGSLAVFTLVNVDRPGATSSLEVSDFSIGRHMYEYLPAKFSITFNNNGNTITQPTGNLFVQRSSNSQPPLATLPVNETKGYILPGTKRTLTTSWSDGFPYYKTTPTANGGSSQKLIWNWGDLSKLRIGRYTAHLVAVYNQAGHDVPIEGTVTFWVIPWKILLALLVIILLLLFSMFMIVRAIVKFVRRKVKKQPKAPSQSDESVSEPAQKP